VINTQVGRFFLAHEQQNVWDGEGHKFGRYKQMLTTVH